MEVVWQFKPIGLDKFCLMNLMGDGVHRSHLDNQMRIEDGFPGFRLAIPLYSSVLHSLFRFAIDGAFFCFYRECSCGKKQANYKSLEGQVH